MRVRGISPLIWAMKIEATPKLIASARKATEALAAAVADITSELEAGALSPLPLIRFPLEDAATAHAACEAKAVGKVVIEL